MKREGESVSALEQRVATLEEELEEAGRRELAALLVLGAAHDANNLLFALRSSLRPALDHLDPVERGDVDRLLERTIGLWQEIGRLTRRGLGAATVDLDELVGRVVPIAQIFAGGAVRIETSLGGAGVVQADELDLERVVLNLLVNAVQHSARGASVRVTTSSAQLSIADVGSGMSSERRTRAFDAFASGRSDGAGLGLTVSRMLVERYGGTLELDSREGVGTTASVRFPSTPRRPGPPVARGTGSDER